MGRGSGTFLFFLQDEDFDSNFESSISFPTQVTCLPAHCFHSFTASAGYMQCSLHPSLLSMHKFFYLCIFFIIYLFILQLDKVKGLVFMHLHNAKLCMLVLKITAISAGS